MRGGKSEGISPGGNLVLIESTGKIPAFKKALQHILPNISVLATHGKLRDFPKKYCVIDEWLAGPKSLNVTDAYLQSLLPIKLNIFQSIDRSIQNAKHVFCFSDSDDEGEHLAWDIRELCLAHNTSFSRHRVSVLDGKAIETAFKHPERVNELIVARKISNRLLERFSGYHAGLDSKAVTGLSYSPALQVVKNNKAIKNIETIALKGVSSYFVGTALKNTDSTLNEQQLQYILNQSEPQPAVRGVGFTELITALVSQTELDINSLISGLQSLYEKGAISYYRSNGTFYSEGNTQSYYENSQSFFRSKPSFSSLLEHSSGKTETEHEAIYITSASTSLTAEEREIMEVLAKTFQLKYHAQREFLYKTNNNDFGILEVRSISIPLAQKRLVEELYLGNKSLRSSASAGLTLLNNNLCTPSSFRMLANKVSGSLNDDLELNGSGNYDRLSAELHCPWILDLKVRNSIKEELESKVMQGQRVDPITWAAEQFEKTTIKLYEPKYAPSPPLPERNTKMQ